MQSERVGFDTRPLPRQTSAMTSADSSLGATITDSGIRFAVWSNAAKKLWVSIFSANGDRETARHELKRSLGGFWEVHVPALKEGTRYGFRADGEYAPTRGLWFDPYKLLTDPYAVEIDRPYQYDARLATPRNGGGDTAPLMPKTIAKSLPQVAPMAPVFQPGGLIYELQVRAFTMRHADIPPAERGTVKALRHPAIIAHLKKLHVSAVELMPVTAWMDERHLQPLGLTNAWGYNPASFMALDPRLCPGGVEELRETVAALRAAGIGVILDLVFNHTAESDGQGPTLSLRGLDANAYYRTRRGKLVNDTGTGNIIACDQPAAKRLILDSLRHFVSHAGVDGFRFDLAPILGRNAAGFDAHAPLLREIATDPVLYDRVLIAEPWDIGMGGYRLGEFQPPFLEWNDKYRDDLRRFWRGDRAMVGALATRLAGSSDVFRHNGQASTRTVNFIAAHDGVTLGDLTAYERKHNEANGEKNRDGHNENLSWNNGVEGKSRKADVIAARRRDVRALLATLFASRGTIMLTAGDEFGRTQRGNNNAYCQDNDITWLDWDGRDQELEAFAFHLAGLRAASSTLRETRFLNGATPQDPSLADVSWLTEKGVPMDESAWPDQDRHRLTMVLGGTGEGRLAVMINGDRSAAEFALPIRPGFTWQAIAVDGVARLPGESLVVEARCVEFLREVAIR